MSAIKLLRPLTRTPNLRPFSTSTRYCKVPSIRDITPGQGESFREKQTRFRDNLEELRQAREKQERKDAGVSSSTVNNRDDAAANANSASVSASAAASASADATASKVDNNNDDGIPPESQLTNQATGEQFNAEEAKRSSKIGSGSGGGGKRGRLSNLIYGTAEGRKLDSDIERSFSEVIARGKYVHSIVFHEVKPDKVGEYIDLVGKWYPRMASTDVNRVKLVGSWRTQVGDNDTFVHIWEYQGYEGYHSSLHEIGQHPEFPQFDQKLKSLINSKRTSLMQEFSFWPTTPPRQLGGIFELRSYTLHPGQLLEWETYWRRGLHARREVMEGVGAWFVQIGELNTVHHLWQYADLEERKIQRETSWNIQGWAETVHKTVPLIQTMRSRILVPMPWSPIA